MTDTYSSDSGVAAGVVEQLKSSGALDDLFSKIDAGEVELTGNGGVIPALLKETLERGVTG